LVVIDLGLSCGLRIAFVVLSSFLLLGLGRIMKSIFISHAVKDKPLADALIELFEGGIGFTKESIFSSSSEGQGIPDGQDFGPYMRTQLQKASVVVAIVTENYYDSAFCLCETGGAWYGEKPFIPLLTPPVHYGDLRGALYGKQASLLDSSTDLNEVYDQLKKHLNSTDYGAARWNVRRDKFLSSLPDLLKKVGKPEGLKAAEADALRRELSDLKTAYEAVDAELEGARKQIAALEQAKSAADVKRIRSEFSGENDEFVRLVRIASKEQKKLPHVVREAVYSHFSGRPMAPDLDTDVALEEKLLVEGEFWPKLREDHPRVAKALEALGELRDFMERVGSDRGSAFVQDYQESHQDLFEFDNRKFWRDNGLL
jgi:hypothetical protein